MVFDAHGLASGMTLALLTIVPGFLFPLNPTMGPLSHRSTQFARLRAPSMTKLDPEVVYGYFSGSPVLGSESAASSGRVVAVDLARPEGASTSWPEIV